jgi:integrase
LQHSLLLAAAHRPPSDIHRLRIRRFLQSGLPLSRDGVSAHLAALYHSGRGIPERRLTLAAIRKLASAAHVNGLISRETWNGVFSLSLPKYWPDSAGRWLTLEQVERLLKLPDRTTYSGLRDSALLALMVGCGLRRRQVAALRWSSCQRIHGTAFLVDVLGLDRRQRRVPVPAWTKDAVDAWGAAWSPLPASAATRNLSRIHRPRDPSKVMGGLGEHGIWRIVHAYLRRLGVDLAPNDLRRTHARLLHSNGAPLEQIRYALGFSTKSSMFRYMGESIKKAVWEP